MNKALEEKLSQGRQYRAMVVEPDAEEMVVRGYATTFNEPYMLYGDDDFEVWEEIDANAFNNCDMSDVIMQYDHEGRVFARLSNGTLKLNADLKGLHIEADLSGTEIGRNLYEEICGGYTNKMSFGFTVKSDERTERHDNGKVIIMRKITEIKKLYDVSAVSLPANDATSISARNYADGVIDEVKKEIFKAEEARKAIEAKRAKLNLQLKLGAKNYEF